MVLNNKLHTYCTVKLTEAVKQAVDARESSWKWVNLSVPVVDGELGKLVLAKARDSAKQNGEKYCTLVVSGDWIDNQYSIFMN